MQLPLFGCICLAGPGRAAALGRALRSFAAQTYVNAELVVCWRDKRVARTVRSALSPRIATCPALAQSLDAVAAGAAARVQGDYLVAWDDDDWHPPTRLAELAAVIMAQTGKVRAWTATRANYANYRDSEVVPCDLTARARRGTRFGSADSQCHAATLCCPRQLWPLLGQSGSLHPWRTACHLLAQRRLLTARSDLSPSLLGVGGPSPNLRGAEFHAGLLVGTVRVVDEADIRRDLGLAGEDPAAWSIAQPLAWEASE